MFKVHYFTENFISVEYGNEALRRMKFICWYLLVLSMGGRQKRVLLISETRTGYFRSDSRNKLLYLQFWWGRDKFLIISKPTIKQSR